MEGMFELCWSPNPKNGCLFVILNFDLFISTYSIRVVFVFTRTSSTLCFREEFLDGVIFGLIFGKLLNLDLAFSDIFMCISLLDLKLDSDPYDFEMSSLLLSTSSVSKVCSFLPYMSSKNCVDSSI